MEQDRDVLFFSTFCPHCGEVLAALQRLGHRVTYVNVDRHRSMVPAFVDRVPTLLRASDRAVLQDGPLQDYIDAIVRAAAVAHQNAHHDAASSGGVGELQPFALLGIPSSTISKPFGYLEEAADLDDRHRAFGLVGHEGAQTVVPASLDGSAPDTRPSKLDEGVLDLVMQRRSAEDENIRRNMTMAA